MIEKNSAYYKGVAKGNLQNNWGTAILVCLIITAISVLAGLIPVAGSIVAVIIAGGSDKNIKLTTKDDLELFKAYLKADKDNWLK